MAQNSGGERLDYVLYQTLAQKRTHIIHCLDKGYAWHTAIGLQAVDRLKTSKYLIDTAIKNIEGDISIDEAQELLNTYYEENPKADIEDRTEEADKVAVRIAKILSEKAFSFTPNEYLMQLTTFLRRMHGILEMHLLGPIITI